MEGLAYRFVCPECGERVEVDEGVHDTLLATGCAVCGAGITEEDFVAIE